MRRFKTNELSVIKIMFTLRGIKPEFKDERAGGRIGKLQEANITNHKNSWLLFTRQNAKNTKAQGRVNLTDVGSERAKRTLGGCSRGKFNLTNTVVDMIKEEQERPRKKEERDR